MYGAFTFPNMPHQSYPTGVDLGPITVLPGGANVHFVRSTGAADYDPPELAGRIFTTVNAALAQCRASRGDTVFILEGHTENVATADAWSNLVAGTRIIGRGYGTMRPTFTFTTATSTVLLNVANVRIENCIFKAAGPAGSTALSVAVAFPVTAAGCQIVGCEIEVGIDADQLCTDCITLSAAADDFTLERNYIYGATLAEVTSVLTTTGAVDRLKILGNTISAAVATAATGVLLDLDNAAVLDNLILGNLLWNKTAASVFTVDVHATSTGLFHNNVFIVADEGTAPAAAGVTPYGGTTMRFGLNYTVTRDDGTAASAILSPVADA